MEPPSKENMKEAFEKADIDGIGKLRFREMKEVLLSLTPEEIRKNPVAIFDTIADRICIAADVNGDKMIDFGGDIGTSVWRISGARKGGENCLPSL